MARTKTNEPWEHFRERMGDKIADSVMERCGSMQVYIPSRVSRAHMIEYVTDNYDGTNARAVAAHLKVKVTTVKRMLDAPRPIRPSGDPKKPYIPRRREEI